MQDPNRPRDHEEPAPELSQETRRTLEEALAAARESAEELARASESGRSDPSEAPSLAVEALDGALTAIAELFDIEVLAVDEAPRPSVDCVEDLTILVVEDNPINQCAMLRMLQQFVTHIDVANHGGEAVIRAAEQDYDLIFMDCMMPVLDGFMATEKIRASGSEVPIVALTSVEQPGIRHRCITAGMNDFMLKPMQLESLRDYLERFVREGIAPVVE